MSTVPGAMISDQALVVHALFANHKSPRLIILTLAPRDFIDNMVGDNIASTPTRKVVSFIDRRQSFFPRDVTFAGLTNCLSNHLLFCDLVRRHILQVTRAEICNISRHPLNLADASHGFRTARRGATRADRAPAEAEPGAGASEEAGADHQKRLELDLASYRKRYNPYSQSRTNAQLVSLEDLLRDCKQHSTAVLITVMPISPANKRLLGPGIYQDLGAKIRTTAARYGANVCDIDGMPGGDFRQSEFSDSVHLSKAGSIRFVPIFTEAILNSPNFIRAFPRAGQ